MKNLFRVIILFLFMWLLYTGNPDERDFNEYIALRFEKKSDKKTGQEAIDDFISSLGGKVAGWTAETLYDRKSYVLFSIFSAGSGSSKYIGIGNTFFKINSDLVDDLKKDSTSRKN